MLKLNEEMYLLWLGGNQILSYIFVYNSMRSIKSKSWSNQEDFHLAQVVNEKIKNQKKLAWNQIAEEMATKIHNFHKIGKQCRERWTNHLNPAVKKNDEWSQQQNQILINLHGDLGNKWSEISKHIPGRTDNCIKNHFNSLMRTGFRKINEYIRDVKRKQVLVKVFKNELLDKVLTFCQGKHDDKFQFSIQAKQLAGDIKTKFALVSCEKSDGDLELREKLFQQICEFKKHCRRKKTKKINEELQSDSSIRQKRKYIKRDKLSQSYKCSSSVHPTSQIKEQPLNNQRAAVVGQEVEERIKSTGIAAEAVKQSQGHNSSYDFCFPNNIVKQEEPSPGFLERSNQLNSSILGSRLLSSVSNLYPPKSASGLFNFVPAYMELQQPGIGFLSTVQDVSQQKRQIGQNFRGQLDFNNKPSQFGQIFEVGQIPMGFVFTSPFESPLHQEPLLGSIPYTNSSAGFNFLSSNMGRQQQELKMKNLRSEAPQIQGQQCEQEKKKKPVVKSLSL